MSDEKKKHFEAFNNGLAYYLKNISRFLFTIIFFIIKIVVVLMLLFPFILIGIAVVSPQHAIQVIEAIKHMLELIVHLFGNNA